MKISKKIDIDTYSISQFQVYNGKVYCAVPGAVLSIDDEGNLSYIITEQDDSSSPLSFPYYGATAPSIVTYPMPLIEKDLIIWGKVYHTPSEETMTQIVFSSLDGTIVKSYGIENILGKKLLQIGDHLLLIGSKTVGGNDHILSLASDGSILWEREVGRILNTAVLTLDRSLVVVVSQNNCTMGLQIFLDGKVREFMDRSIFPMVLPFFELHKDDIGNIYYIPKAGSSTFYIFRENRSGELIQQSAVDLSTWFGTIAGVTCSIGGAEDQLVLGIRALSKLGLTNTLTSWAGDQFSKKKILFRNVMNSKDALYLGELPILINEYGSIFSCWMKNNSSKAYIMQNDKLLDYKAKDVKCWLWANGKLYIASKAGKKFKIEILELDDESL